MTVEYAGKVIATTEMNLAHDSYFFAYVWKGGEIVKVETGSTAYYGGMSVKVGMSEDTRLAVEHYMMTAVEDYITDNAPTVPVKISNGTRVKSLTSKGKAFGVVGKVVGSGTGQYGDFFKVKDEKSGRTVIVSRNKVKALDSIEITSEMWRYAFALTLGDSKANDGRFHVSGFAKNGVVQTVNEIAETLASILSDIGENGLYTDWDDYMSDVDSTDDMAWIRRCESRVGL